MFRICRVITILWQRTSNTVRHRWPGTAYSTEITAFIPDNAGVLIVPCCRGGSALPRAAKEHIQNGTEPAMMLVVGNGYSAISGFSQQNASRTGKNPQNKFLGVCWMQGEFDLIPVTTRHTLNTLIIWLKPFVGSKTIPFSA